MDKNEWQPTGQHWQVNDAVSWIVYRTEPDAAPQTIIPNAGNGRMTSETLMAALQARAARNPRSWPPNSEPVSAHRCLGDALEAGIPAYRVRFVVRRWMREENVDATRLFTKASKSLAKYKADIDASGEQQALFTAAIRALNAAARNGIITILAV